MAIRGLTFVMTPLLYFNCMVIMGRKYTNENRAHWRHASFLCIMNDSWNVNLKCPKFCKCTNYSFLLEVHHVCGR